MASDAVVIVDYGMGNLRSVQKALEKVGAREAKITADPDAVRAADKVLLPGVGAVADAMTELKRLGLDEAIKERVAADRPLLGVCLGLQLLFDVSEENGEHEGLGLIPGRVRAFPSDMRAPDGTALKVPHMGWNAVNIRRGNALLNGTDDGTYFYFVHSYYGVPEDENDVALEAEHGTSFCAMVCRGSLYATQFHPEKSQGDGLKIYDAFVKL
jgi:glutamine amidotransferase